MSSSLQVNVTSRPLAAPSEEAAAEWRVSIISHGHGRSVAQVLSGLQAANENTSIRFVLTINIPEDLSWVAELPIALRERLQIRRNQRPRSFAVNHNNALSEGTEPWLIAADPELVAPFPQLEVLRARMRVANTGLIAPQAVDAHGNLEDNGRSLPSPLSILCRNVLRGRSNKVGATYLTHGEGEVTWLAGFFLASRRTVWEKLGGFDTRYRMYCEDVDLSLRCWLSGYRVVLLGQQRVGHMARRATFKNPKHLQWHVQSLCRLWTSTAYRCYVQRHK